MALAPAQAISVCNDHQGRPTLNRQSIKLPLIVLFAMLGILATTSAQHPTRHLAQTAVIAKFFIEDPQKSSHYETGPLHIIYSNGTEIVQTLPPYKPGTAKEAVFNDVGFASVQLAEDQQTIGWTINNDNTGTSYSIPLRLVVFRHGHVLHTFDGIQMVWSWMFVQGGEKVAIVSGPTHGPEVGDYRLYSVTTGKLIAEVWGDEETQTLKPNAPTWAKRLEEHYHNRQ